MKSDHEWSDRHVSDGTVPPMKTQADLDLEAEARKQREDEMKADGLASWRQNILDGRKTFTGISTPASRARDAQTPDRHLDYNALDPSKRL